LILKLTQAVVLRSLGKEEGYDLLIRK